MEIETLMKNAVALYVGKGNVLLYGKKAYINENRDIVPYRKDSSIMVPVSFFIMSIKEEQEKYNEAIASVEYYEIGPGEILYASLAELCSIFGWYLHIEENGIIVYSIHDMENVLDWSGNLKIMRKLSESYIFDDVNGQTMYEMLKKRHPNYDHPRLILTPEKIQIIKDEIKSEDGDLVYKKIFSDLKMYADRFLEERTSGYEIRDGIRLLYVCRENSERMLVCALMYLLTENEEYAFRAYMEMYVSACFIDWNPYHFLDVGEMSLAMGLAYDWLYKWMNDRQRRFIRKAIIEKGIHPIIDDFDDKPRKRSWNWRGDLADNWRMVISGVGCASLAIVDELLGDDLILAQRTMEQTLLDIRGSLALFAPLGAYEEGCSYWGYAMEYFAFYINSLRTALGSDFGYVDVPGMRLTNKYMISVNGSVSIFNYHDCGEERSNYPPQMMFLADYFGQYSEALPRICQIMTHLEPANRVVSDMLYYSPKFYGVNRQESSLDCYLPISEIATMRSGWKAEDTYLGFHCDNPIGGEGHDHMDTGTFVLDAQGENFILDLGSDNYNIPNYYHSYRVRAEGHNTIIFNPDYGYAQNYGGIAKIIKYEFSEKIAFAIGDLTDAYEKQHGIQQFYRGVRLDRGKNKITIQDEIKLSKLADIWWFAHTRADIELLGDRKRAILSQNGKKLLATIEYGDNAYFSVMPAKPLPTSPIIKEQNSNEGVKKLTIHIPKCKNLNLKVTFISFEDNVSSIKSVTSFDLLQKWTSLE